MTSRTLAASAARGMGPGQDGDAVVEDACATGASAGAGRSAGVEDQPVRGWLRAQARIGRAGRRTVRAGDAGAHGPRPVRYAPACADLPGSVTTPSC